MKVYEVRRVTSSGDAPMATFTTQDAAMRMAKELGVGTTTNNAVYYVKVTRRFA